MWLEVLVEGTSDVPAVKEVLIRRFGLEENINFRIHPHKGRGKLPSDLLGPPDPRQQTLLNQLPAKLRGFSHLGDNAWVIALIDVDGDSCIELLKLLRVMLKRIQKRPSRVLFRLAIEETESWFIADLNAVRAAYPRAKTQKLANIPPDAIVGAWEQLSAAMSIEVSKVTGVDKTAWAERIVPHLNLQQPISPSLRKFIEGIQRAISASR
jgi:hypothetical protein